MRTLVLVLAATGFASAVGGEELVARLPWEERAAPWSERGVEVLRGPADEAAHLRLERRDAGPPLRLVEIEAPPIATRVYALRGTLRYEGVEGEGFLEMWSVFPDGSRYFSRTLAPSGPLRSLVGSSPWRTFVLPFESAAGFPAPARLEVNLVLPGRGVVELGPLELVAFAPGEDPLALPGQWWTTRHAGLVGGAVGLLLGTLGALAGVLAARRRAPRLLAAIPVTMGIAGLAALAAGLVAVAMGQPWAVYYPLLLGGGIATALAVVLRATLRRRSAFDALHPPRARDAAR